jgi:hypothetical protein
MGIFHNKLPVVFRPVSVVEKSMNGCAYHLNRQISMGLTVTVGYSHESKYGVVLIKVVSEKRIPTENHGCFNTKMIQ